MFTKNTENSKSKNPSPSTSYSHDNVSGASTNMIKPFQGTGLDPSGRYALVTPMIRWSSMDDSSPTYMPPQYYAEESYQMKPRETQPQICTPVAMPPYQKPNLVMPQKSFVTQAYAYSIQPQAKAPINPDPTPKPWMGLHQHYRPQPCVDTVGAFGITVKPSTATVCWSSGNYATMTPVNQPLRMDNMSMRQHITPKKTQPTPIKAPSYQKLGYLTPQKTSAAGATAHVQPQAKALPTLYSTTPTYQPIMIVPHHSPPQLTAFEVIDQAERSKPIAQQRQQIAQSMQSQVQGISPHSIRGDRFKVKAAPSPSHVQTHTPDLTASRAAGMIPPHLNFLAPSSIPQWGGPIQLPIMPQKMDHDAFIIRPPIDVVKPQRIISPPRRFMPPLQFRPIGPQNIVAQPARTLILQGMQQPTQQTNQSFYEVQALPPPPAVAAETPTLLPVASFACGVYEGLKWAEKKMQHVPRNIVKKQQIEGRMKALSSVQSFFNNTQKETFGEEKAEKLVGDFPPAQSFLDFTKKVIREKQTGGRLNVFSKTVKEQQMEDRMNLLSSAQSFFSDVKPNDDDARDQKEITDEDVNQPLKIVATTSAASLMATNSIKSSMASLSLNSATTDATMSPNLGQAKQVDAKKLSLRKSPLSRLTLADTRPMKGETVKIQLNNCWSSE